MLAVTSRPFLPAYLRRVRAVFALSISVVGLLVCMQAAMADGTTQCDRKSSLGAAVDQCPNHVNPCCLERVESGTMRYQIMRDSAPASPASVLIVALAERDGITSDEYSTQPVIDFWNEGWKAAKRYLPTSSAGGPVITLVMNAGPTRGYNRLHIHISCASPKLISAIRGNAFSSESWTPVVLTGISALHVPDRTFRVRITPALIDDPSPAAPRRNPFSLVIADVPAPDLQNHAMAIVGRADRGDWYLLDRAIGPSDPKLSGYIEDALDETCGGRPLRL
jgi:CDP-diacylglycerol pyrophosphatase